MKSILVGVKNVLLWSYARGTWQYDALCLLIVLAVFLVPSRYFGDRDRAKEANVIALRASNADGGAGETYVEAGDLDGFLTGKNRPELSRTPKEAMRLYLSDKLERNVAIDKLEPLTTPDGKVIYKVWFK
ncbi:MAG: hypothetical protein ACREBD_31915 [Blastocatellia bacterium]